MLFSKPQRREIEAWYKESMEYPVYRMDTMTDSKESEDLHGKSTNGSRFKTDSESGEDQIEKSQNLLTTADGFASINQDPENPKDHLPNQSPTSDNLPLSFKDKLKQQDIPTISRTKVPTYYQTRLIWTSLDLEDCRRVRNPRSRIRWSFF